MPSGERGVYPRFVLEAATRPPNAGADVVAAGLDVSARPAPRVSRGPGNQPKAFNRFMRFHRALGAARQDARTGGAGITAAAGYYDQAHLIAEFRTIAGVTPCALVDELCAGPGSAEARSFHWRAKRVVGSPRSSAIRA